MKTQYFILIVEGDMDLLSQEDGKALSEQIISLKKAVDACGHLDLYNVKDITALRRFQAEIKRLNP